MCIMCMYVYKQHGTRLILWRDLPGNSRPCYPRAPEKKLRPQQQPCAAAAARPLERLWQSAQQQARMLVTKSWIFVWERKALGHFRGRTVRPCTSAIKIPLCCVTCNTCVMAWRHDVSLWPCYHVSMRCILPRVASHTRLHRGSLACKLRLPSESPRRDACLSLKAARHVIRIHTSHVKFAEIIVLWVSVNAHAASLLGT